MFLNRIKNKVIFPIVIVLVAAGFFGLLFATLQRQSASADADFQVEFEGAGFFDVASSGIGTRGVPATGEWTGSGVITLNIPMSATVTKARMIWTGRAVNFDADGVRLAVDGVDQGVFNADLQFSQFPWCCSSSGQLHESVDVTNFIMPGMHTYTISDHEHGLMPTGDFLNYGVGIWAVYAFTPTVGYSLTSPIENSQTIVYQGQDSFFRQWDPPRGPHTEVRCAEFNAATYVRVAELTHLVSGVDTWDQGTNAPRFRPVAVWHASGDGPVPPKDEIVMGDINKVPALAGHPNAAWYGPTDPVANPIPYPLQSYAGLEWDNFEMAVQVPAGHTWLCFQIESGDSQDLVGQVGIGNGGLEASGMWNLFTISFRDPTEVGIIDFYATAVSPNHVRANWETEFEIDHYGFNLYRSSVNDFATAELIHFELGDSANANGAFYTFNDFEPQLGKNYYWLEDIDNSGEITRYGSAQVNVSLIDLTFLPLLRK
ncbi:MAG: hypothetical protein AAF490_11135 [Chloroflexota bacterium]